MEKFKLSENFVNKYKRKKPPFGFNGLGELVYMRTYSRIKEDGKNALKEAQNNSAVKHLLLDKVEGFQVKS